MRLALRHEGLVAFDVAGRNAADFLAHEGGIARAGHHRAVMEADVVEGIERLQRHVIGERGTGERPQLLEDEGGGDDGGAGIEGEAVLAEHRGAAARLLQLLEHADAVAPRAQPDRRGEPAQAAADHGGMGTPVRRPGGGRALFEGCKHQLTLEPVELDRARGLLQRRSFCPGAAMMAAALAGSSSWARWPRPCISMTVPWGASSTPCPRRWA